MDTFLAIFRLLSNQSHHKQCLQQVALNDFSFLLANKSSYCLVSAIQALHCGILWAGN